MRLDDAAGSRSMSRRPPEAFQHRATGVGIGFGMVPSRAEPAVADIDPAQDLGPDPNAAIPRKGRLRSAGRGRRSRTFCPSLP